ncbi:hypothetical protein [Streptomonospora sp. PA3]|uniref:hypothetical protein n=1 Tax=Streptomonospora sp. PA3 TaxID=2607326 RepID=UPI001642F322|nr:hypothetical protein [Streptomonospora sp. PA3]
MHESPKSPRRFLPETKVATGTASGAGAALVLWLADLAGLDMPQAVAAAIVTLVMAVAAWLAPHTRRGDDAEGTA